MLRAKKTCLYGVHRNKRGIAPQIWLALMKLWARVNTGASFWRMVRGSLKINEKEKRKEEKEEEENHSRKIEYLESNHGDL